MERLVTEKWDDINKLIVNNSDTNFTEFKTILESVDCSITRE